MTQPEAELVTWTDQDAHRNVFYLAGMRGTVQFVFISFDLNGRLHEDGVDVGYHSPTPRYPDQRMMGEAGDCHALRGSLAKGPCYYDGSSLRAAKLLRQYREAGDDVKVIWDHLLAFYYDVFYDPETEGTTFTGAPYLTPEETVEQLRESARALLEVRPDPVLQGLLDASLKESK